MNGLVKEMNRRIKQHGDMIATVERIRESKKKAVSDLEKVKGDMKGKSGRTYQKMNDKQVKILEDIKKYNNDLKNCVKISNKIRENVYGKEMQVMLEQVEGIASEWNGLLCNMFTLGNDLDIEILKNTSKYCLKIQQSVQKISWGDDLKEFVEKWKNVHTVDDIVLSPKDLIVDDQVIYEENTIAMMNDNGSNDVQTKQCSSNGSNSPSSTGEVH